MLCHICTHIHVPQSHTKFASHVSGLFFSTPGCSAIYKVTNTKVGLAFYNCALLLQVAQLTYPVLLSRYDSILNAYSQQIQQGIEGKDRLQLDETLCVLEVCTAMTVAPAVADAALQLGSLQQVIALASIGVMHRTCSLINIAYAQKCCLASVCT